MTTTEKKPFSEIRAVIAVRGDPMSELFPLLAFHPDETPLSFAARLAAFHTGDRLVPFLSDMGIKPFDLAGGEAHAIERLCATAGVDRRAVIANTASRVGKRRFNLRGHPVSAEFFSSPDTVFCPACLKEDDDVAGGNQGARRGRLLWTLRPVRTCPQHGLALVHRARERWDDQFHELAVRVPERGDALEALTAAAERRRVSPLQEYAVGRLRGRAGSAWLDAQTLEQAVRATEMLGVLVEFGASAHLNLLTHSDWDRAGCVGHAFTSAGEAGIREALHRLQTVAGGRPGRRKVFGRLYEWLSFTKSRQGPGDIRRILREHIFETMEVAAGEPILGATLEHRRLHSVASLAGESGLDARTLRNVLVARGLVPDETEASAHHVFDAAAGSAVAASIRRLVHIISLPKTLNCTRPQADQLIDERLLAPLSSGAGNVPGRTQKAVDAEDVAAFLESLLANARPADAAPPGRVPISKAAEKAKVPSVAIVQLILGGFLETESVRCCRAAKSGSISTGRRIFQPASRDVTRVAFGQSFLDLDKYSTK